jgi:UPF0755 protein
MKKIFTIILAGISAVVCAGLAAYGGFVYLNLPPAQGKGESLFVVEEGESVRGIALRLEELSLIKESAFFRLLSKIEGTEGSFKVGTYRIEAGTTALGIHNLLVSGKQVLYKVTIPEGLTISRIGDILEKQGIVSREAFINAARDENLLKRIGPGVRSAEGFIYPDTYLFPLDYPPDRIVLLMIDNFFSHLEAIYPDFATLSPDELYRKVVLASIIEGEYRDPSEAPLIASVFINRSLAEDGLRFLRYRRVRPHRGAEKAPSPILTFKDLEVDSPFNTYKLSRASSGTYLESRIGLSLRCAFFPAESPYSTFCSRIRMPEGIISR